MRIERTKNAVRNIGFGSVLKVYQILMPFLMRTVMLYFLGVQYLGLSSLFTSIIKTLNLVELGVGSAMVYSMYRPIAEDNEEEICALMRLYRTYYRIIGAAVLGIGLALLPVIPKLITGSVPSDINIYILYLLNLGATVLSYWLFAYKNCLLNAYQRVDISSKVMLITNTLQYGLQLLALCYLHSYYLYLIIALATQILTNIVTAVVVEKLYPKYSPVGKLDKNIVRSINNRIRDLFTAKLGGVVVNSADTIVISAFLGLNILAIYQNYYYILNSIISFVAIIFTACTAGIGNSVIVESKEKNYNDLKKFTFLIAWLAGFCTCCLLCLYQPFMEIWTGKELMLEFSAVICFCLYYFVYEINQLLNMYKDAAGIWHTDRFRPIITALANLVMNLIMVQLWGIYGVLLSTVLSTLFIGMPWILYNLFSTLFEKAELFDYVKSLLQYMAITVVVSAITFGICQPICLDGWMGLLVKGITCCIISNILYVLFYHNKPEFLESLMLIDRITGYKLKLDKRILK